MLPTLSLIVPAKNEEKVIGNCIKSLLELDYPKDKLEIIVSIDGSTDRTVEICKQFEPKIRVLELEPKKCKAEALNETIPMTNGEIIGIFDADCIVDKNCIKHAVKHFSKKDVVAVEGTLKSYNKKESMVSRAVSLETCVASYTEHLMQKFGASSILFGKNMFIRKSLLEKVGGFDEKTFLEDTEMTVKIRKLDYKIAFEPKAITWHEEPTSMKSYFKQRMRWARGMIRVSKLNPYISVKRFVSHYIHSIYFYSIPFLSISTIFLLIGIFLFNIPLIFFSPLIILLLINVFLYARSLMFYKEPLKDLLFLPLSFVFCFLHLFIMFKALYYEQSNMSVEWYKADRTGTILK